MFKRKDFVTSVIILYLILLILFFANHEKEFPRNDVCGYKRPCVRFCCFDPESCSNKFFATHFNKSLIPGIWDNNQENILFHSGKPSCSKLEVLDPDVEWVFNYFGGITSKNSGDFYYGSDEYCFESSNSTGAGPVDWNVYHCAEVKNLVGIFQKILMGTALLFIAATVVVNVLAKSLHFFQGKCEFMVFLGLFFVHVTYPVKDHDLLVDYHGVIAVVLAISLLITLMWTNVLVFDIFWTFRNPQVPVDEKRRFKNYCWYAFGSAIGLMLSLSLMLYINFWYFLILFLPALLFCFGATFLVNSLLLLITGVKIFGLSKTSGTIDHHWFEAEKERFWKYLVTFVIVYVLWSAELSTKLSSSIVPVFLISLSTFVMFVIFALDKASTLFKRYDEMDDDSTVA